MQVACYCYTIRAEEIIMPTEEEIKKHLEQVNAAYKAQSEAAKRGQEAYNKATWQYAKEANWFVENGIKYTFDQGEEMDFLTILKAVVFHPLRTLRRWRQVGRRFNPDIFD
jgi:hypothetical protein